jgi:membrane-bound inhibitor of C-type lysozyme
MFTPPPIRFVHLLHILTREQETTMEQVDQMRQCVHGSLAVSSNNQEGNRTTDHDENKGSVRVVSGSGFRYVGRYREDG